MRKTLLAAMLAATASTGAQAATIYGVDETNNLVTFDGSAPGAFLSSVAITGSRDSIEALDFRPGTSTLYGMTLAGRIFTIDTTTGAATLVAGSPVAVSGSSFAFDFNPTTNGRIRIVSNNSSNYVFDANTGALTTGPNVSYGDGVEPDVTAAAYTQNADGTALPGGTTLYTIDTAGDLLATQNTGTGRLTRIGSLGRNIGTRTSFDIMGSDAFVQNGTGFYRVDLGAGTLTQVGSTQRQLFGIAVAPVPEPATWATMIMGFGLIGFGMRRRDVETRVRFV